MAHWASQGLGPIEALFNRDGFPVSGGPSIVNATSWDATEGYQVTDLPPCAQFMIFLI